MLPGDNCRSCHGAPSSRYPNAPNWTVAGTVFEGPESALGVSDVIVEVSDATGFVERLTTNSVGNFYTATEFINPYSVSLEHGGVRVTMPVPPPSGGCNACHNSPPVGDAPGRLYVPTEGTYPSIARCEGHVVTIDEQTFDCAPYVCVSADDSAGDRCRSTCENDEECTTGRCSAGICSAE